MIDVNVDVGDVGEVSAEEPDSGGDDDAVDDFLLLCPVTIPPSSCPRSDLPSKEGEVSFLFLIARDPLTLEVDDEEVVAVGGAGALRAVDPGPSRCASLIGILTKLTQLENLEAADSTYSIETGDSGAGYK